MRPLKNKKIILAVLIALNVICLTLTGYYVYSLSSIAPRIEIYGPKTEVEAALEGYVPVMEGEAVVICRDDMNVLFVQEICDVLDGNGIAEYSVNDMSQTHRLARYYISVYGFALMIFSFIALSAYLSMDFKLAAVRIKRQLRDRYFADIIKDKMYIRLALKWLVVIILLAWLAVNIIDFQFIRTFARIDLPAKGQAGEFMSAARASQLLWKIGAALLAATEFVMLALKGGKDRCPESER